jgi:hypothetical protein
MTGSDGSVDLSVFTYDLLDIQHNLSRLYNFPELSW